MKGFIFAAGIGSRLKPWTDHHPKALAPVGDKPMLQRVIENMQHAGINDIIINVHHMADQIISFIQANNSFGANIAFSDETACLLDTGGAIVMAAPLLAGTDAVLIHNADIFTDLDLTQLIDRHTQSGADATLLTSTRQSSRQLIFDTTGRLQGWINHTSGDTLPLGFKPADSHNTLSFNGIHVISQPVIAWLTTHAPAQVFPIIPQYIAMSPTLDIRTYTPATPYTWVDIGKPANLAQAQLLTSNS